MAAWPPKSPEGEHALKIDQSFVRDIVADNDNASISQVIITLGHSLGLHVIAEGV